MMDLTFVIRASEESFPSCICKDKNFAMDEIEMSMLF